MPEDPAVPEWLVDVVERQFGLAPYLTAAVWKRAVEEGRTIGDEQGRMTLVFELQEPYDLVPADA